MSEVVEVEYSSRWIGGWVGERGPGCGSPAGFCMYARRDPWECFKTSKSLE